MAEMICARPYAIVEVDIEEWIQESPHLNPNVQVERRAAAPTSPKPLYPDSSIPSDDQRRHRRVSAPTQVRLPQTEADTRPLKPYFSTAKPAVNDNSALSSIALGRQGLDDRAAIEDLY
jgi:hypothetical protein